MKINTFEFAYAHKNVSGPTVRVSKLTFSLVHNNKGVIVRTNIVFQTLIFRSVKYAIYLLAMKMVAVPFVCSQFISFAQSL